MQVGVISVQEPLFDKTQHWSLWGQSPVQRGFSERGSSASIRPGLSVQTQHSTKAQDVWQIRDTVLKHGTCPVPSVLSVSQQKKFKSTSSSLSCVFDPSPLLPVLYYLSCAKTLRRRLGLHEQRCVAVLLSAVNNDSRNAVLAGTAVPHHRKTLQLTPLIMCFGSYCLPGKKDGLDRKSCNMSLC